MTKTKRNAAELLQAAKAYYGDEGPRVFVDENEQVVHPACGPMGCVGVLIVADGTWREGWYRPDRAFRPMA